MSYPTYLLARAEAWLSRQINGFRNRRARRRADATTISTPSRVGKGQSDNINNNLKNYSAGTTDSSPQTPGGEHFITHPPISERPDL